MDRSLLCSRNKCDNRQSVCCFWLMFCSFTARLCLRPAEGEESSGKEENDMNEWYERPSKGRCWFHTSTDGDSVHTWWQDGSQGGEKVNRVCDHTEHRPLYRGFPLTRRACAKPLSFDAPSVCCLHIKVSIFQLWVLSAQQPRTQ